jgi:outer membrane protein assembly factor BamC
MRHTLAPFVLILLTSGCSMLEEKKIDYKSAGTVKSLEVPPDLALPRGNERYNIPGTSPRGSANYSDYDRDRGMKQSVPGTQTLLPNVEKISIERAGTQRWLVVQMPPKDVWPLVKDFWQELGFFIEAEQPETGVLETDWAENRAKIPQEGIRKLLGKALDMFYSTAERDKFRTRIEPRADGNGTEIYISHRGMVEIFEGTQSGSDQGQGRTVWQPRPSDPELEADMLRRLMVRLGTEDSRAQTMVAQKSTPQLANLNKNSASLALPEPFDRAWRRVGLALDRIGFVVEDRDRAAGVYFVRYADPEADAKAPKKGFLDKLAFWRGDDKKPQALKYQVRVKEGGGQTGVSIHNADGTPAVHETGNRIATLLHEQLK